MKKFCVVLCCVLLIATCFTMVACGSKTDKNPVATSYVTMDINPSIELVVDQNNNVMSVYAGNEDGEILLYGEDGIVNVDVNTATQKILSLAVEYGYLNEDNCGVQVSVATDNSTTQSNITSIIKANVETESANASFSINFSNDVSFSIQRQLNELDEKYSNITAPQLKLMLSAMACDSTLTFDVAAKMSTEELLAVVQTREDAVNAYYNEVYKTAVEGAEYIYDKVVVSAKAAAFASKYYEIKGLVGGVNSAKYGVYVTADYALQDIIRGAEVVGSYEISSTKAQSIAESLGVEVSVLENDDGKVTIASIENYIDKEAKNLTGEAKSSFLAKYETLMTKLDEAETEAENEENTLDATTISAIKTALNGMMTYMSNLNLDDEITLDTVKTWLDTIQKSEYNLRQSMLSGCSESEKESLLAAETKAESDCSSYKSVLDTKISEAKTQVETYLSAKKTAVKTNN